MSKHLHLVTASAIFVAVVVVTFRPLFFRWDTLPAYRGEGAGMAEADRNLNAWILAWVAHALTAAPGQLFQGNILYPAPDALAGSEHMLAHVPVTVPTWLGWRNAAYVLKAMMLESLVLTALAGYVVVRHHTGDVAAALVAGTLLTLSPWRFEPAGVAAGVAAEPQYLGFAFLPFALVALARWFEGGRRAALAGFTIALAAQALASFYLGYAAFAVVPVYALALLPWRRPGALGRLVAAAGAVGVAGLLVVPTGLPYLRLRARGVLPVYDVAFVHAMSVTPWSYLTPGGLRLLGPVALVVGIAFALVRVATRLRGRGPALAPGERAAWVLLAAGLVLGWGPYQELPGGWRLPLPFLALWRWVPGFSAMRGPGRFVVVVSLALALVAGHALAALGPRLGRARGPLAAALIVFTIGWCAWTPQVPEPSGIGAQAPPLYRWLAARPAGEPVLELPARHGQDDLAGLVLESRYALGSTVHWQPLMDGYTAYEPATKPVLLALADRLPDAHALDLLLSFVDLRWVLVHPDRLVDGERAAWAASPEGLRVVERATDGVLYAVTAARTVDRRALLADRRPGPVTLEGTPRAPLPEPCRAAGLAVDAPPRLVPSVRKHRIEVRVENRGPCAWPALDVGSTHLVMLEYVWLDGDGDRTVGGAEPGRLGGDVAPGASREEPLYVYTPRATGTFRLRVSLRQQGDGAPLATAEAAITVAPG